MRIVISCGEVSDQVVPVAHFDMLAVEQIVHVKATNCVVSNISTFSLFNMVEIFFAHEPMVHSEATSMLKSSSQITFAHHLTMFAFVATMMSLCRMKCLHVMMIVPMNGFQMLHNDWVTWADFKGICVRALAQKHVDCLLVTKLDTRLHCKAVSSPEFIKVLLTNPLRGCLRVIEMFSLKLNALVMLNIVLKLVVIDHCMAKESEFMTCL